MLKGNEPRPKSLHPYAARDGRGSVAIVRVQSGKDSPPMKRTRLSTLASLSLPALLALSAVPNGPSQAQELPKQRPVDTQPNDFSGTLERADKDMALVIKKLMALGAKPIGTLSVEETRKGPTPADAVKAVLKDEGKDLTAITTAMKVKKQDATYPTGGGTQPLRIYTPEGPAPQGGFPVIVYFHGGGWVIADINTYEASAMALAQKANAIVASAEYRHAPENKFPAQHEDANAAYRWVLQSARSWGGDANRVAVVGESAGGNLAVNVAITARDQKLQMPLYVLSVYPIAGTATNTPSYMKNANAIPLNKSGMEWFFKNAISKPEDMQDPRLNLLGHANLMGLPPTFVITAEIDPLMSEGKMLADKLKQAGVATKYENFAGVTHEFFSMGIVVKTADRAEDMAAEALKKAFHVTNAGTTGQGMGNQKK